MFASNLAALRATVGGRRYSASSGLSGQTEGKDEAEAWGCGLPEVPDGKYKFSLTLETYREPTAGQDEYC